MATPKKAPEGTAAVPPATAGQRKPWIKKTPVDVVLEQITKQEEKLAREERELAKLQQAKKLLEAD